LKSIALAEWRKNDVLHTHTYLDRSANYGVLDASAIVLKWNKISGNTNEEGKICFFFWGLRQWTQQLEMVRVALALFDKKHTNFQS
jgi:hypothetical protein